MTGDPALSPLRSAWLRAGASRAGELTATVIRPPGSSLQVGWATTNDILLPGFPAESFELLSNGVQLSLRPGAVARMAGSGWSHAIVVPYDPAIVVVEIVASRVAISLDAGWSVYLMYSATRANLDALERGEGTTP